MPNNWVSKEQIEGARTLDLLSYLQKYEPGNLQSLGNKTYCTREHDSLKLSNGKWYWWSRGIGGVSALDYLIKVRGMDFVRAVRHMCALESFVPTAQPYIPKPKPKPLFVLPEKNENNDRAMEYLTARGIDRELIHGCIDTGRLYEDKRHNCVFVGYDRREIPRFAFLRSSSPSSTFMGDVKGSDKRYSFCLPGKENATTLYVFESAIDALSHATLVKMKNADWKQDGYLALSGVYQPGKELSETPLPIALSGYLHNNPLVEQIRVCFDNDRAGELAARAIQYLIGRDYDVQYTPPKYGKDYNEMLMNEKGLCSVKTRQAKSHNLEELSK